MQASFVVTGTKSVTPSHLNIRAVQSPPHMAAPTTATSPKWAQKTITLSPLSRGCHLITPKVLKEIGSDLSDFRCGLAHFFLQHTSASLTINENYDTDVRDDTETFLNTVVPEGRSAPWKHTLEGSFPRVKVDEPRNLFFSGLNCPCEPCFLSKGILKLEGQNCPKPTIAVA